MSAIVDNENVILDELVHNFYKGSLKFTLKSEDAEMMTWARQEAFLNMTVCSNLMKKYPVNNEFCRLFFKKLIQFLEPHQEVHDNFYTYLCSVMKSRSGDTGFCYRHYIVNNDIKDVLTIRETNNMVVNGTTGMRTWEAALMLSDWALCNKDLLINKKVLELGSGIGFTGITIAKLCQINSITLSDCHQEVLNVICENIKINLPHFIYDVTSDATVFKYEEKKLGVMMLDWNCIENMQCHVLPDIIIGADIIYDPSILQPLCKVIDFFFNRNKNLEVYISSVIRNEETFNSFLSLLGALNHLQYEKLLQHQSVYIDWDSSIQRCLLKIKYK